MSDADAIRPRSSPVPPNAGARVVAAFVVSYVVLDALSFVDPFGPLGVTPWNPPPGLALFVLLLFGLPMVPWLFVAALAAQIVVRGLTVPWELIASACAILAAGYGALGHFLRGRIAPEEGVGTLRGAALFTAAVVPATLLIAIAYVGLFAISGTVPRAMLVPSIAQFWIGDLIGIVVTTPLLLALAQSRRTHDHPGVGKMALQLAAICGSMLLVFGWGRGVELKLFYIVFLPLIWIAVRWGVFATALATLVIQIGLIIALLSARHEPGVVLDFQLLMLTLAFTGLFLSVSVEERWRSEQKLRDKQFELDRSLRAAATSELASTLAHELNQPLSAIASYTRSCQLLLETNDPDRELAATLDKVAFETNRAGTVVRRLREFVRTGTLRTVHIDAARFLAESAETLKARAIRHGVTITVHAASGLPAILGDRIQLDTVILNLLTNAIDSLTTWNGERTVHLRASTTGGNRVQISVSDTGRGIAPDGAASLFQPLETTKAHGMGLGLAISRTIVEAHGGRLWFEPAPTGATFHLSLPTSRSTEADA